MDYAVLPLGGKKSVVLFQNYSYSFHMKGARKLQCSRKVSMQCGAYLKMDKDKRIVYADTYHTHPPTLYRKTASGLFVKMPRNIYINDYN